MTIPSGRIRRGDTEAIRAAIWLSDMRSFTLLELLTRLRVIGLGDERGFRIPLTQEQIGEMLGLTGVHVSRTLRWLRDEGLVVIEGHRVKIKNFDALSALGDFDRAHLRHFQMSEALLPAQASHQN